MIAPPEDAGNSAPGWVMTSIFSIEFAGIPSKKDVKSLLEILRGRPLR